MEYKAKDYKLYLATKNRIYQLIPQHSNYRTKYLIRAYEKAYYKKYGSKHKPFMNSHLNHNYSNIIRTINYNAINQSSNHPIKERPLRKIARSYPAIESLSPRTQKRIMIHKRHNPNTSILLNGGSSRTIEKYKYIKGSKQWKLASRKAKALGVHIEPSYRKYKKLDVYQNHKYVTSIGDTRYSDWNYHQDHDRRQRYKKRHNKFRHNRGTTSFYADQILW